MPAPGVEHAVVAQLGPEHARPGHRVRATRAEGSFEGLVAHSGEHGVTVHTDDGGAAFAPWGTVDDIMPPGVTVYGPHSMAPGAFVRCSINGQDAEGSVLAWGTLGSICEVDGRQIKVPYDRLRHVGTEHDLHDPARALEGQDATRTLRAGARRARVYAEAQALLVPTKATPKRTGVKLSSKTAEALKKELGR